VVSWDDNRAGVSLEAVESGAVKWPPVTDGVVRLTSAQLAAAN
jgi:hypothetical protein